MELSPRLQRGMEQGITTWKDIRLTQKNWRDNKGNPLWHSAPDLRKLSLQWRSDSRNSLEVQDLERLPWWLSGKESFCQAGDKDLIPGSGDPLEKQMAIHSSIPVWKISRTEEPGGLKSMGSQRVRHDLGTKKQQVVRIYVSTAGVTGLIFGWRTKTLYATWFAAPRPHQKN